MNRYEVRRLNLIKLKDELCDGRISILADKIDKNPSYVSRLLYEEGKANKKNIADKVKHDIEAAFNLKSGWLDLLGNFEVVMANSNGIKIDVLEIEASCGNGLVMDNQFDKVLKSIEFTEEFAAKIFGRRKTDEIKVITAKGDSMTPTIKSGANIFVDIGKKHFDGDGVYVFIFDNEIYIKRIQITGTEIIVISDNPIYEKWRISKDKINDFYFQGKVFIGQNIDYVYFD